MGLFDITPDLLKLAEPAKKDWHSVEVHKITSGLSNKGNKKVTVTFKIFQGEAKGNYAFHTITDLNTLKEYPQFLQRELEFLSALIGRSFDKAKGASLFQSAEDMQKVLKGKQFDGWIDPTDFEGTITNQVTKLRPLGSGKKA